MRYNDVWIFNTKTEEWSQPHAGSRYFRCLQVMKPDQIFNFALYHSTKFFLHHNQLKMALSLMQGSQSVNLMEKWILSINGKMFLCRGIIFCPSIDFTICHANNTSFIFRGSHSATLIGSSMYVFGGYGGAGFSRKDFNDVSVLNLETWEWRHVDCKGDLPESRSGHQVRINELRSVFCMNKDARFLLNDD